MKGKKLPLRRGTKEGIPMKTLHSDMLTAGEISAPGAGMTPEQAGIAHGVSMIVDTGWGAMMQTITNLRVKPLSTSGFWAGGQ
jgi:hypothetical protein